MSHMIDINISFFPKAHPSPDYAYGLHEFVNLSAKANAMKDSSVKKIAQAGAYCIDFLAAMLYNPAAFILNNALLSIRIILRKKQPPSLLHSLLKNDKVLVGLAALALVGSSFFFFNVSQQMKNYFSSRFFS